MDATKPGTNADGTVDIMATRRRGVLTPAWLRQDHAGRLPATPENVEIATRHAMRTWRERAAERKMPEPEDLSGGCMMAAMLVKAVFGGAIRGNYDHVYGVVSGAIVDLSSASADVAALADPYRHDAPWMRNADFRANLADWTYRVERVAAAVIQEAAGPDPVPEAGDAAPAP